MEKIFIYFDEDIKGQKVAFRLLRLAGKNISIRIDLLDAELLLLDDNAILLPHHPTKTYEN